MSGAGRAATGAVLVIGAFALGPSFACGEIQGVPLSGAPINSCAPDQFPCARYIVSGFSTKPDCNANRCDFGRPSYKYTVVVSVPDSSFYAPGRTFVLTSDDFNAQPGTAVRGSCNPPLCVQLPEIVSAEGTYQVTHDASVAVGLPLDEGTSIPIRVTWIPISPTSPTDAPLEAAAVGFPAADILMSSQLIRPTNQLPPAVLYSDTVALGRYLRIAYPEAPYDQFFPPAFTTLRVSDRVVDTFLLGGAKTPLDDPTGVSRNSLVTRADGLDGWHVLLADHDTGRRISSVHTLSGRSMQVRLDTVGQTQPDSHAIRDGVDVIVAPPDGWLGVPRLQSRLNSGSGHENLPFPPLPPPVSMTGVVAHGDGQPLTGIPARLVFTSSTTGLLSLDSDAPNPLLMYSTTVSTDDSGHFATVLPPGFYDVTIEPAEETGLAKVHETLDTSVSLAKTFRPPARTIATGRAVLADGRPLAEADILALPSQSKPVGTVLVLRPRPARARTDANGAFQLELDQGQYDFIVDPQAGTSFPRVVQARSFGTGDADIGDIVVAPPARLSFTMKDPSQAQNPIARAMVRVFAELPGRGAPAVEIGRAMTGDGGECEILLAQQPR